MPHAHDTEHGQEQQQQLQSVEVRLRKSGHHFARPRNQGWRPVERDIDHDLRFDLFRRIGGRLLLRDQRLPDHQKLARESEILRLSIESHPADLSGIHRRLPAVRVDPGAPVWKCQLLARFRPGGLSEESRDLEATRHTAGV